MPAKGLSLSDPSSFSNPDICEITDMNFNLTADFDQQIFFGYVDIVAFRKDPKGEALVLDVKDLDIQSIKNKITQKDMNYTIAKPVEHFGSKLEIKLPKTATKKFTIRVEYETSPCSGALQWLDPSQTAGKCHPYMFSKSEAILARTMFPCQDSPRVKFTYSAAIKVPAEFTVLMSAVSTGESTEGKKNDEKLKTFKFIQKVPIPSYLVAIAIGVLESREIGPRSHIWSEKEFVDKATPEFSEIELLLKTAEELLGSYVWEVYNVLLLPPSFAYGTIENPCVTFITPTVLTGGKVSICSLAHEIAHSFTGNLVTHKTFEHFWINEAFAVFLERKIYGKIYGEPFRHFCAYVGYQNFKYDLEVRSGDHPSTKLVPDLKGIYPDYVFSSVPYEKGHAFLFYLEKLLGGPEVFEEFMKAYIEKFKFQSIDSSELKSYIYEYFTDKKESLDEVDWEQWFFNTGEPPVDPKVEYDILLFEQCTTLYKLWADSDDDSISKKCSKADIDSMKSEEILQFLIMLLQDKDSLSQAKMQKLTEVYEMENIQDAEIRFRWLLLGILFQWKPIIDPTIEYLKTVGRMKFVLPLYRSLYEWDETQSLALSTYKENCDNMMYVTSYSVGKALEIDLKKKKK